ncbi:CsgG/HfaB family protein [Fulvivirgaceae bacterium BMA10]|uniref:CsgG/HfaB family protein n=1 Tax=Splendidivirga corallicola TaxID=3051826 RepID=A0ABT8KW86_9BACT|nr:CsgG/HfaB family protein [Fulvivirgaceae bacterium BMA10]
MKTPIYQSIWPSYISACFLMALSAILISPDAAIAQNSKDIKTDFESVKSKCKDTPVTQRTRVTVARFNATTRVPGQLGRNMATMLTNALYEIDCFSVLESLQNKSDMINEVDFGESDYADGGSSAAKGKMKGAQVVITGEVTEFSEETNRTNVRILRNISATQKKVKLGFIVKLLNPQTREILWSKSVQVEGQDSKANVGFFRSASNQNPALANALEQGVLRTCEYLVKEIPNLHLPGSNGKSANALSGTKRATVIFIGADYTILRTYRKKLETLSGISSVSQGDFKTDPQSKLETGTLTIQHSKNSFDDLLDSIVPAVSTKFKISKVESSQQKVTLKLKG